jgi:ribokinase
MIVVFGSVNVDLIFDVPSLPAAGETVLAPAYIQAFGGKGANQAVAAARDGANVVFAGCVGSDALGAEVRSALKAEGIDVSALAKVDGPTGLASIAVDPNGANQIVVGSAANAFARADLVSDETLATASMVVLQMEVPPAETAAVIEKAKAAGLRVLLNLAPAGALPEDTLRDVDTLVVNEVESAALASRFGVDGAAGLAERLGRTVIETRGADGIFAYARGRGMHVPAMTVEVKDTTGAGDCFVGVLAAALDKGENLEAAIERAGAAASLACTVRGAQPSFPKAASIDAALARAEE